METKRVVVIEGEDASPEAVRPTIALIDKLNLGIEWVYPPVGDAGLDLHNSVFPEEARRAIDESDRVLQRQKHPGPLLPSVGKGHLRQCATGQVAAGL